MLFSMQILVFLWAAALMVSSIQANSIRAEQTITPIQKSFLEVVVDAADKNGERRLTLGTCQGDCDNDSQCSGSLVCCQRNPGDPVPCCNIGTGGRTDFCAAFSCCRSSGGGGGGGVDSGDTSVDVDVIGCFSAQTTTNVLGKGLVSMENLRVGDRIQTSANEFETIYAFGHFHPLAKAEYLLIETSDQEAVLEVTKDHLVYKRNSTHPVRAGSIQVGDKLEPNGATVSDIGREYRTGLFTPLVASGSFLVNSNGLKVSSYSALVQIDEYAHFQDGTPVMTQQAGIHLFLTPYRAYCTAFIGSCQSYNVARLPHAIALGIDILSWADQQPTYFQWFLFLVSFLLFGAMFLLEQMVVRSTVLLPCAFAIIVGYRTVYGDIKTEKAKQSA